MKNNLKRFSVATQLKGKEMGKNAFSDPLELYSVLVLSLNIDIDAVFGNSEILNVDIDTIITPSPTRGLPCTGRERPFSLGWRLFLR